MISKKLASVGAVVVGALGLWAPASPAHAAQADPNANCVGKAAIASYEIVGAVPGKNYAGQFVTVNFTMQPGCIGTTVGFAAYKTQSPTFVPEEAPAQVQAARNMIVTTAAPQTMSLTVPDTCYQLDFFTGDYLTSLGPLGTPNFYGERNIYANNGYNGCTDVLDTSTTTAAPTTTTSTTGVPTTTTTTNVSVQGEQVTTSTTAAPKSTVVKKTVDDPAIANILGATTTTAAVGATNAGVLATTGANAAIVIAIGAALVLLGVVARIIAVHARRAA